MLENFIRCAAYLVAISALIYILGRLLPYSAIREDSFPFASRPFERQGRFYLKLGVKRWKPFYPDASIVIHKIIKAVPEKNLKGPSAGKLQVLIKESCKAELTHLLALFAAIPCPIFFSWPGAILGGLYFLINLPAIVIQRYNRPRLLRAAARLLQKTPKPRRQFTSLIS